LHAAPPIAINTRTANDSAQRGLCRYAHAKPPSVRVSNSNASPPPNPPGRGTDAAVVVPLQNVFSTIATSVGPPGVSVTDAGSGAQVIVGEDVVQLNVTVPLNPGIDVSTMPIANLPPGGTGGKAPPGGGVTEIEIGELETVSTVDPVTLSNVAEIVVVKAVVAPVVASPLALIVAAWVFEDAQATVEVMSFVLLSEKVPVAVNCSVELIGWVGFAGVTAIDVNVADDDPVTVVEVVAVLSEVIGSGVVEVTLTVFTSVPACVAVTTIVIVALAWFAIVPKLQVTVVVPVHVPTEVVADTKLTPAGNASVIATFWALSAPLFITVIV
jgi:hypothetical protein